MRGAHFIPMKDYTSVVKELTRTPGDDKLITLEKYCDLLLERNRVLNLTSITDRDEVMRKHFIDSLMPLKFVDFRSGERVLDLGTGGGFPGIPLKIFCPDTEFVLVDSVNKKLDFIRDAVYELGLRKIEMVHGRAEDLARDPDYREKFDYVVSRAVASLPVLLELTMGFLRPGGVFVSYKGSSAEEEIDASGRALKEMCGKVDSIQSFRLPGGDEERTLIFIRKERALPDDRYPRKAGTPAKKPLA